MEFQFFRNLQVSHRFAVLGLVGLVLAAIPTFLFLQLSLQGIHTAELEAKGVDPIKAVMKVVQLTQQHRGLSAMVLGGRTDAQSDRRAKQEEVGAAAKALIQLVEADAASAAIKTHWGQAQEHWASLSRKVEAGQISGAQSFDEHTATIDEMFTVLDSLSDFYGLSLDPELDSYMLIQAFVYSLPALTEELGKARARGAGMLAAGNGNSMQRQSLAIFVAKAEAMLRSMQTSFEKASNANASIKDALASSVQEASEMVRNAGSHAQEHILQAERLSYPSSSYFDAYTRTINALVKLNARSLDVLDEILNNRVSELKRRMWTLVAVLLALLGVGAILGMGAARSITSELGGEPAQVMAIASGVAQGDLSMPIHVRKGPKTASWAQWRVCRCPCCR